MLFPNSCDSHSPNNQTPPLETTYLLQSTSSYAGAEAISDASLATIACQVNQLQQEITALKSSLLLHSHTHTRTCLEQVVVEIPESEPSEPTDEQSKKANKQEKLQAKNEQLAKKIKSKTKAKTCCIAIKLIVKTIVGVATTFLTLYLVSKTK